MDLRCPKCNSTDLKKISLAYQEGLYRVEARARLRAAVIGGNGPDLVVGRVTMRGAQQSAISKRLNPPTKWSYLKVSFWSALAFLSIGWLVFYVHAVSTNSSTVLSPPVTLFGAVSASIFVLLLLLVWKHNHSYPRHYAQWDRSFICERCEAITQQELDAVHRS
ncbi:MAG: hypothetical protein LAN84_01285 [Acidobacteriia bacterium]|nr:hypothetical protein [Terriglobia bacterium]